MKHVLLSARRCRHPSAFAQDDLLSLLGQDSTKEYTTASSDTRVINGHSLENTAHGVLDVKIQHRFGFLSGGIEDFFGLDQATIRLGSTTVYGRIMVGFGRSSYQKTVDGFIKYRRSSSARRVQHAISAAVVAASSSPRSRRKRSPGTTRPVRITSRTGVVLLPGDHRPQVHRIVHRELMPGLVHRNLVKTEASPTMSTTSASPADQAHQACGGQCRYFYVCHQSPNHRRELAVDPDAGYKDSFSIGFDIERGDVFPAARNQRTGMFERAYITETTARDERRHPFRLQHLARVHRHTPGSRPVNGREP
jgi:hypothetical protein